jgi:hypothetical protein
MNEYTEFNFLNYTMAYILSKGAYLEQGSDLTWTQLFWTVTTPTAQEPWLFFSNSFLAYYKQTTEWEVMFYILRAKHQAAAVDVRLSYIKCITTQMESLLS